MAIIRGHSFPWRPFPPMFNWEEEWPDLSTQEGLDIYETDNSVVVEASVPGVPSDKVEITVEGNILSIKGNCEETEEKKEKKKVVYRSSCRRSFQYSTSLPRAVNGDAAEAEVENGVVRITIPKKKEEMPKKITVKTKGS